MVVGSLDALYQSASTEEVDANNYQFIAALQEALATIPENVSNIFYDIQDPLGLQSIEDVADKIAIAEEQGFTLSTLDKMAHHFDGQIGAYAYLLLILLYFPCVATFGAIKQELGWRWALYSGSWSMFLGYSVAVGFYQTATYAQHPQQSLTWLGLIALAFAILYGALWQQGKPYRMGKTKLN